MNTGVYTITCLADNKMYVGSTTVSFSKRWGDHKSMLNNNKHTNIHLQRVWNKYGSDSFLFEILETCKPELVLGLEQFWINMLGTYADVFNRNPTAANSCGVKRSPETLRKMRETTNYMKANAAWRGCNHTEETRKIIKEKRARQVMKPLSDERKKAMSEKMRGRKHVGKDQTKYLNIIAEKDNEILRFANTKEAKEYFGLKKTTGISRVLRKERHMYLGYTWRVEMP